MKVTPGEKQQSSTDPHVEEAVPNQFGDDAQEVMCKVAGVLQVNEALMAALNSIGPAELLPVESRCISSS